MTSTDPGNALFIVFCQNEYWAILRWGNMRWLGNERKGGVGFFFPAVSQVTRQVDLLISKEATSQNKAFCTSPQWNIYLFYFLYFAFCLCFLTPPFSSVWYYVWTRSLSIIQNIGNKVSAHEKVCTPSLITEISFAKCPDEKRQVSLQSCATCQNIWMAQEVARWSLQCWTSVTGQTSPVTASKPVYNS